MQNNSQFIDSIGVNAHLDLSGSTYATSDVLGQMRFLGLTAMRVVSPYDNLALYTTLGAAGIRFDAIVNTTDLVKERGTLDSIAPFLDSVEGPNEVNTDPPSYQGLAGAAAAIAFQHDLFNAVRADPALKGVAVLPYSLSVGGALTGYGDVTAYADDANVHGYAAAGVPPYYMLDYAVSSVTTVVGKPVIMTETGYYTLADGRSGVTQDVQAKWLIDSLLQNSVSGIARTYLYQLEDGAADNPADPEQHYGLFDAKGTPKLAATAIHTLTTLLADPAPLAASYTPGAFDYAVTGLPLYSGFQTVFGKSDGSFDVALWSEPRFYDPVAGTSAVTPSRVTVSLPGRYDVSVFDVMAGTDPIQVQTDVNTIEVALGTDPLIVHISPRAVAAAPVITGLSPATDTGRSQVDGVTADAAPVVAGTALAEAAVTLWDGAAVLGSARADESGQWSVGAGSALADGTHALVATVASGGTTLSSAVLTLLVDTARPRVTGVVASSGGRAVVHPGQVVTLRLTTDKPVFVDPAGGLPGLLLNTGGVAAFDPTASTSRSLAYTATIGAGENAADLRAVGLVPNGAAITDLAGNALDTTGLGADATGLVVTAPQTVTLGTGPDRIVVSLSEDAWQGDATFTLAVDGHQVGGVQTATALHAAGLTQAFILSGSFGGGSHLVTATFTNDYSSAGGDRNLYVDSLTDGATVAAVNAVLPWNGTKGFWVDVATPTTPDPLFDPIYYRANNPDLPAGIDLYQQYMTTGWQQGRSPSALFSTAYYLAHNPDVAQAGVNPLAHYEAFGWREGRDPSASFSVEGYLERYPDVAQAGIDPLWHYLSFGQAEGRSPAPYATAADPLIDTAYILAQRPDIAASGIDVATWFNETGWRQGVNPDPDFDTRYYLAQNPDVARAGVNPLQHYETSGWREHRDPSLLLSTDGYLQRYPDVAQAGIDPLLHYITNGQREGRTPSAPDPSGGADPLVDAAFYDPQLGATLIPTDAAGQAAAARSYHATGWQLGLNPDPWFDAAYYRAHDPAAAGTDPLLRFETEGWKLGFDPSARFSTSGYLAHNPDVAAAGIDPLLHYLLAGQAESRAIYPAG